MVEKLAMDGHEVEVVTPDRLIGQDVTGTLYPRYLAALYQCHVRLTPETPASA